MISSSKGLLWADNDGYLQLQPLPEDDDKMTSRYQWRMVSPVTEDDWDLVTVIDNCQGSHPLPVGHVVRGHVYHTWSEADVVTEAEIARHVLVSAGGDNAEYWRRVNIRDLTRGGSRVMVGRCGYKVPPCHTWKLYQLVGRVRLRIIKFRENRFWKFCVGWLH